MRILVCGGRYYDNFTQVCNTLNKIFAEIDDIDLVIHGGATGADKLAQEWAEEFDIKTEIYMPRWHTFGNSAGPIRNQRMIDKGKPDLVQAGIKVIEVKDESAVG